MAHNISEASGSAEMFYYGDKPWHGLGNRVDHVLTAREAILAAGLDWEVEKKEIFFEADGQYKSANCAHSGSKAHATVRTDINIPLGIVGKHYRPIQNSEAFSFMDSLTATREAKYHTAGALFSGERVWMLAKLPDPIEITKDDAVDKYLLLVNNHDGKGCLKVFFTPIRVVCMNTLNQALNASHTTVSIAHTGDVHKKVIEAQRVLGIAIDYFDRLGETFSAFAMTDLSFRGVEEYIKSVLPGDNKKADAVRNKVFKLYEYGAGSQDAGGTVWGAYNAVVEYVDHMRTDYLKKPDRYIETINFGTGARIKTKAFEEASRITFS